MVSQSLPASGQTLSHRSISIGILKREITHFLFFQVPFSYMQKKIHIVKLVFYELTLYKNVWIKSILSTYHN